MTKKKLSPPALPPALPGAFTTPEQSLAGLDAQALATLLPTASDLTLVLDAQGLILDLAIGSDSLAQEIGQGWIGKPWAATVSEDSVSKINALLAQPTAGAARWRHVNHPNRSGGSVAMSYITHLLPASGRRPARVFAFGQDQRATAALQQRLLEAQLSVERDYARFRQAELRYRHLFQMAGEAVLVVDASSSRVLEANPAAAALLGMAAEKLVGQEFPVGLSPRGAKAVTGMLATVRRAGRAEAITADLLGTGTGPGRVAARVSATLFHQDQTHLLLVRLARSDSSLPHEPAAAESAMLTQLAQASPDGLVVTDVDGHVLAANAEFVNLCQMAGAEQMRGQSLDRWLGRTGVDLGVLVSNLRQRGTVKLFATTLRGEFGVSTDVEISAAMVPQSEPPLLGFSIRDVGRRLSSDSGNLQALPRSVNQLTELVGRVPMKDIVGETTDLIEKRCIEAALELTRDNRASAAEILGLSRQSLYVKLRRFGMGDLGPGVDK